MISSGLFLVSLIVKEVVINQYSCKIKQLFVIFVKALNRQWLPYEPMTEATIAIVHL